MLAHFSADMSDNLMAVLEFNPKLGAREIFTHDTVHLDNFFFTCHNLTTSQSYQKTTTFSILFT